MTTCILSGGQRSTSGSSEYEEPPKKVWESLCRIEVIERVFRRCAVKGLNVAVWHSRQPNRSVTHGTTTPTSALESQSNDISFSDSYSSDLPGPCLTITGTATS